MPELYPEDQKRVDEYLNRPENKVERESFKLLRLLGIVFFVLAVLTGISYIIAVKHGIA